MFLDKIICIFVVRIFNDKDNLICNIFLAKMMVNSVWNYPLFTWYFPGFPSFPRTESSVGGGRSGGCSESREGEWRLMMSDANIWSSSCLYHHEDHQDDDHQVKVLIKHCAGGPGLVWSVSARPSSLHTVSWSMVTDTSSHCCCCCTQTFHFLFVSEINDK